ncbi:MAG: phosphate/phosphite/phosphonate ABC transporter substrate-binding protein, partial [Anaerolineae bacterium]|nr:phosphate/phosphite/phosphonate ABC transporter substrate-binding protein [Anaerolineae bacterium]
MARKVLLIGLAVIFLLSMTVTASTDTPDKPTGVSLQTEKTILDIIKERRTLRTLGSALEAAGLTETLAGEGPFTVFAPISAAFRAVPDLDALLADTEALSLVLQYHVVPGNLMAADLAGMNGQQLETAAGEMINVTVDDAGNVLLNDTVRVVTTDVEASNGVVHFVDLVLTPPSMIPTPEPTEEAAAPATTLGTEDDPIVLLFIPSENAQEVQAGADDLAGLVSEKTGLVVEARVSTDFAAAIEAMCSGEAEMGALNTFSYILAHERGCADVGVVSTRFGSTYYQGQVVVSADSGITDFEGLKGTTFCRPDPLSTSGWIIPSIAMQANGVDPDTDLEVVDVGGHDAVITAVYNGECEAGATFVDARGNVADEFADVNDKVLVIAESAPIPNDTLSFSADVPEDMREAIVAALLEIATDEENLALLDAVYSWGGLEAADDTFFDDFRQQLDAAGVDIE